MWLLYYFNFERNYDVSKPKSPYILSNKIINFGNGSRKWEIPHPVLERRILCFSSYKNRKLKGKLWWVGVCKRIKKTFFEPFILSKWKFLKICVLSRIHFQNMHTSTYQKALLHTLFLLALKMSKSLQCILKKIVNLLLCDS